METIPLNAPTITCGVTDHPPECLCDVKLAGEPAPINFAGHEINHADLVIKYRNLGAPWTSAGMATLIEGLGQAAEALTVLRDVQPGLLSTYKPAIKSLIAQGHSMVDIPNMVGLSLQETAAALMSGRVGSVMASWGEREWLAFEADVLDGKGSWYLNTHHAVPKMVAHRLVKIYRGEETT